MRKKHQGFARQDRINAQMMKELAELIRTEIKDPRMGFITLNSVSVTRDYSHARIYYTVLDPETREVTQEVLDHRKGFLRSELGKRIRLYRIPELHFIYDSSLEEGENIQHLLNQVADEPPVQD